MIGCGTPPPSVNLMQSIVVIVDNYIDVADANMSAIAFYALGL
jgi:hypothetical protein